MEFRALLSKLFKQLSDIDRQALEYSLRNRIPRSSRPSNSSHLLDDLLDQNLITEENCDYLIQIFERNHCFDAAAELKEYQLRTSMDESSTNMRSFSSEHKEHSDDRLQLVERIPERPLQFTSNASKSSTELEPSMISSNEPMRKQSLSTIPKLFKKKCHFFPTIFILILISSILFCSTLFFLFWIGTYSVNDLPPPLVIRQELFHVMKEGFKYGNVNPLQNQSFNDAKDCELSYADRCIGVELRWNIHSLISIRFLYTNNRSSSVSMGRSRSQHSLSTEHSSSFMLHSNEKINKINLYRSPSETNIPIVGIQFRTTDGRKSDVYGSNDGHFLTESFESYTFAYAKGIQQKDKGIQMLQFVWIKQTHLNEQIVTVPHSMVEICQFMFTRHGKSEQIYVKGVESSWYDLKYKFNRQGTECNSAASYYEKISERGPQLFAIVNHTSVFYHDQDQWQQYNDANEIECDISSSSELNSTQQS